ncbi:aldose 1-epimerase family protein [Ligilactobacillus sp. WILCCON 0076]|uniref:Aldose 1-epimerase family protein n=1 Tax=Ligilactobacillus ubinensis TaxID=2876789 RepID=A0A9X2JKK2_9LACO|nr:aldose 1-epimerase family protein [Ligilactobacillus ubinensis]MCP0886139.1 aldose 1-epimerase family protein [Ligilactobacillus ubinensis]
MVVVLENKDLYATIKEHGAELSSLRSKKTGYEYIWYGDAAYWSRQAPVLFPIVGKVKNGAYYVGKQKYHLGQHGFARDMDFTVVEKTKSKVILELLANEATKASYPFDFILQLTFELCVDGIKVSYTVKNPSASEIYFSIGGHPAFNVPITTNEKFDDYRVELLPTKKRKRIPLIDGLIKPAESFFDEGQITVQQETFKDDALIYALENKPTTVRLVSSSSNHGVSLTTEDAAFVGIWSPDKENSRFVCLEPWWGVADSADTTGDFTQKIAINKLAPTETFHKTYQIKIF